MNRPVCHTKDKTCHRGHKDNHWNISRFIIRILDPDNATSSNAYSLGCIRAILTIRF